MVCRFKYPDSKCYACAVQCPISSPRSSQKCLRSWSWSRACGSTLKSGPARCEPRHPPGSVFVIHSHLQIVRVTGRATVRRQGCECWPSGGEGRQTDTREGTLRSSVSECFMWRDRRRGVHSLFSRWWHIGQTPGCVFWGIHTRKDKSERQHRFTYIPKHTHGAVLCCPSCSHNEGFSFKKKSTIPI